MELQIEQLCKDYEVIQALDLEWCRYLNSLDETQDFGDQEVQDQEEYCDESGYNDAMDLESRINKIDRLRRTLPVVLPPFNPSIQQVPPGHPLSSDVITQSQAKKDGSAANAVPSTSGFLTRNGGSPNQAALNAHQEVGTDQLKDDMPGPSIAQLGLDDRKEPSQQQLSQEQLSQVQSPQQEQGMDPLPSQKLSSPQGQFSESSGQTVPVQVQRIRSQLQLKWTNHFGESERRRPPPPPPTP